MQVHPLKMSCPVAEPGVDRQNHGHVDHTVVGRSPSPVDPRFRSAAAAEGVRRGGGCRSPPGGRTSTLRTWDRRYDLGPSERVAGAHRRYTDADVARLLIMRRLTLEGVAPADAASIARSVSVSDDALRKPALPTALVQAALYPAGETASTNAAAAAIRLDQGACTRIL